MKTLTGTVTSNKMTQTVVVKVEHMWQHPVYKKQLKRSQKYMAHTDKSVAIGKVVRIGETRPISKNKSWKVVEVLKG